MFSPSLTAGVTPSALRGSGSPHRLPPAEVAVKFPNHSITAAMLLLPGLVSGGTRGLFSGKVMDSIGGVVALVVTACAVWWRVTSGRSREVLRLRFVFWPHHVRQSFAAPWLLSYGQWGPLSLRSTHGRLRGSVRGGCEWLSAQTISFGLLVQAVASIPVPTSWCVGLWFVLCGIQLISAVLTVVVRPARAPATNVLQATSLLLTISLEAVAGLVASRAVTQNDVATMFMALSLSAMILSAVKSVHTIILFLWERRQNEIASKITSAEEPTMTATFRATTTGMTESTNASCEERVWESLPNFFLRQHENDRGSNDGGDDVRTHAKRWGLPQNPHHHLAYTEVDEALAILIHTICVPQE